MGLITLLKWRYATKKMSGQKVPQAKVEAILEAISLSASSFGLQPYKVLVVQNEALKTRMVDAAWGQLQLKDSSHVLVFAAQTKVSEKDVTDYVGRIALARGLTLESLEEYKNMMLEKIVGKMSESQQAAWTARQAYIALGTALLAAAEQQVDATPMEGFVPAEIDALLDLKSKGLTAVLLLPLGYRADGDWLAPLAKVRKSNDDLIEIID